MKKEISLIDLYLKSFFGGFGIGLARYAIFGRHWVGALVGYPASIAWGIYCVYEAMDEKDQAEVRKMVKEAKASLTEKGDEIFQDFCDYLNYSSPELREEAKRVRAYRKAQKANRNNLHVVQ